MGGDSDRIVINMTSHSTFLVGTISLINRALFDRPPFGVRYQAVYEMGIVYFHAHFLLLFEFFGF
jgi:hypothetical protein